MNPAIRRFQYNGEDALVLPAQREAFITLQEWLESIARELNLPAKTRNHILIASDEVFSNIAKYGYPTGDGTTRIMVACDMANAELIVTFSDTGIAYNPLETPPPDINAPLEERKIGGLGIFMVKNLMDSVDYRHENNCNFLTFKKKFTSYE